MKGEHHMIKIGKSLFPVNQLKQKCKKVNRREC